MNLSVPAARGFIITSITSAGRGNYKWINTVPLPKIWEQMNLAWHYGATNLWIVNVGDIKPEEVPLDSF